MAARRVSILTYHSISEEPGPTSIPPAVFRGHLEALEAGGYRPVSLGLVASWLEGSSALPERPVAITFDDGFADFAEQAAPLLTRRGWTATVFLPSGRMGGAESWIGANTSPARPLMTWEQVAGLAEQGIEFGGHSVTHPDLTTLSPEDLTREIRDSRDQIGARLGRPPASFAPPYGASNPRVREEIARWYRISVGTTLRRATPGSDRYDLPRIEMHYFRSLPRWRAWLEGRGELYFGCRRALRAVRALTVGRP